jgi:hypothetical protein
MQEKAVQLYSKALRVAIGIPVSRNVLTAKDNTILSWLSCLREAGIKIHEFDSTNSTFLNR